MNATARDPRTIEAEADRTREAMAETLDALQHKLSPGELLDRSLRYMRENGGELAGNLGNDIKSNPVPTLLVGVGLAWMMASGRREPGQARHRSMTGRKPGEAEFASGRRAGRTERAKHAAQSAAGTFRDRTNAMGEATSERYEQARAGFGHMLDEQPLMLGGLAFALGAAAGAAVPRTQKEEEALHRMRGEREEESAPVERAPESGSMRVERESNVESAPSRDALERERPGDIL